MSPKKSLVSEADLVAGLRIRSESTMAALYDQYSAALYGVLFRMVNDEAIASDLLQDAFVKIWKSGEGYDRSKGTLFTWMLNIARNTGIDYLRSKQHKAAIQTDELDVSVSVADWSTADKSDYIGLKDAVGKLKPDQQTVLDLLYFKGYTQEQAAELLEIPLGTVKTRVRTAVMVLREQLSERKKV